MDTNFPLKVVCPECCAAITAKCHVSTKPRDPHGYAPLVDDWRTVDWFHFARIEKAEEMGFGVIGVNIRTKP
jgi:hypothetical protein